MENKKTFGAYILQRRRELGMTQKELAQRLYVTESAVSKWERGLSYPDITLLQNICSVLEITEHELLSGSEDTNYRVSEKLAEKYRRLTRSYRVGQYIFYGLILVGSAIGNLLAQHTMDWFFIVLAGVMMAASFTLVPALAAMSARFENYKIPLAAGSFILSLELLLLICCIYSRGDWFFPAGMAVLFGIALIVLPFLLPTLPLPETLSDKKASIYLITVVTLLLLLLLVCCIYMRGDWFPIAAVSVLFGLGLFILPVLLHQLPLNEWMSERKMSVYLLIETGLLLLLMFVCDVSYNGDWFLMAAAGVLFGLGLFILPVLLHQCLRGFSMYNHKALIYLSAESFLLFLILFMDGVRNDLNMFFTFSLPLLLLFLTLPWGIMGILRYLPIGRWLRTSAALAWSGLWIWLAPWLCNKIIENIYGEVESSYTLRIPFDLTNWDVNHAPWNVIFIILVFLGIAAVICALIGLRKNHIYRSENKKA